MYRKVLATGLLVTGVALIGSGVKDIVKRRRNR